MQYAYCICRDCVHRIAWLLLLVANQGTRVQIPLHAHMKTCTSCKVEKPETEYHKCSRFASGLMSQCKVCHKGHNKRHYQENAQIYKDRAAAGYNSAHELVRFIKEEGKCEICSTTGWWRLAFHHKEQDDKVLEISLMRSLRQVLAELPKCMLVCHNCHADIHHGE